MPDPFKSVLGVLLQAVVGITQFKLARCLSPDFVTALVNFNVQEVAMPGVMDDAAHVRLAVDDVGQYQDFG